VENPPSCRSARPLHRRELPQLPVLRPLAEECRQDERLSIFHFRRRRFPIAFLEPADRKKHGRCPRTRERRRSPLTASSGDLPSRIALRSKHDRRLSNATERDRLSEP